jgi:putative heme-binding domain-containing protein
MLIRAMVALMLFAANIAAESQKTHPRTSPEDIAAGAKTFRSHCAPCHGYNAEGGRGPNLAAGRLYHGSTDADLLSNISNGIPGTEMPGLFYSEDRICQVIAYIRSLVAHTEKPEGDAQAGAALFQEQGCTACHRIRGSGGASGPDLSSVGANRSLKDLRRSIVEPDAEVPPRYWVVRFQDQSGIAIKGFLFNEDTYTVQLLSMDAQLLSYEKATVRNYQIDKHSIMPAYNRLTEQQLNNLVAYLWTQRPE